MSRVPITEFQNIILNLPIIKNGQVRIGNDTTAPIVNLVSDAAQVNAKLSFLIDYLKNWVSVGNVNMNDLDAYLTARMATIVEDEEVGVALPANGVITQAIIEACDDTTLTINVGDISDDIYMTPEAVAALADSESLTSVVINVDNKYSIVLRPADMENIPDSNVKMNLTITVDSVAEPDPEHPEQTIRLNSTFNNGFTTIINKSYLETLGVDLELLENDTYYFGENQVATGNVVVASSNITIACLA